MLSPSTGTSTCGLKRASVAMDASLLIPFSIPVASTVRMAILIMGLSTMMYLAVICQTMCVNSGSCWGVWVAPLALGDLLGFLDPFIDTFLLLKVAFPCL